MDKNLKIIPLNEMGKLEREFLISRVEQIEENYRILEQQKKEQMKQKLAEERENRQLTLRKILEAK